VPPGGQCAPAGSIVAVQPPERPGTRPTCAQPAQHLGPRPAGRARVVGSASPCFRFPASEARFPALLHSCPSCLRACSDYTGTSGRCGGSARAHAAGQTCWRAASRGGAGPAAPAARSSSSARRSATRTCGTYLMHSAPVLLCSPARSPLASHVCACSVGACGAAAEYNLLVARCQWRERQAGELAHALYAHVCNPTSHAFSWCLLSARAGRTPGPGRPPHGRRARLELMTRNAARPSDAQSALRHNGFSSSAGIQGAPVQRHSCSERLSKGRRTARPTRDNYPPSRLRLCSPLAQQPLVRRPAAPRRIASRLTRAVPPEVQAAAV